MKCGLQTLELSWTYLSWINGFILSELRNRGVFSFQWKVTPSKSISLLLTHGHTTSHTTTACPGWLNLLEMSIFSQIWWCRRNVVIPNDTFDLYLGSWHQSGRWLGLARNPSGHSISAQHHLHWDVKPASRLITDYKRHMPDVLRGQPFLIVDLNWLMCFPSSYQSSIWGEEQTSMFKSEKQSLKT